METKGYKKLQIYQSAHLLAVDIHRMTLSLPAIERFEEGGQIRRSSKSVSSNIVEGFALRRYNNEFVHYLFRAYASGEDTMEHLEPHHDNKSLADGGTFNHLHSSYRHSCGLLVRTLKAV